MMVLVVEVLQQTVLVEEVLAMVVLELQVQLLVHL
jgi:hypothetical protein